MKKSKWENERERMRKEAATVSRRQKGKWYLLPKNTRQIIIALVLPSVFNLNFDGRISDRS